MDDGQSSGRILGTAAAVLLAFCLPSAPRAQQVAGGDCLAAPAGPFFCDATAASGIDFTHFNGMSGEYYFVENMGAGLALLDYDRDGDLDLYLIQGTMLGKDKSVDEATFPPRHPLPLTDRLYRNDLAILEDGRLEPRFVDVTAASGIDARGYGMGVATGDYDGDGWVDLYVTNYGPNQLLRNNGDGTFADLTEAAGVGERRWSVPAVFFDADGDGRLDLYVGNYVDFSVENNRYCPDFSGGREGRDYCGAATFAGESDRLFRNRGDATFEDLTTTIGMQRKAARTLGAVAADVDGDGRADLYVANDMDANQLWTGGGGLADDALLAGCAVNWEGQPEAGMGVDAGDIDGDGDEDLFVSHLMRQTNTLYLNDGGGMFRDETLGADLGTPSWDSTGFGAGLFDFDNDGLLDVLVVNGSVEVLDDLARSGDPYPLHQPNQLYRNRGDGGFEEFTDRSGEVFRLSEVSRGAAFGDVDNDGDIDVAISNNAGPARLLLNRSDGGARWVGLRILDAASGSDLYGARVAVEAADGATRWRRVRTDGSYVSAHDPRIVAGLGAEGRAVRLAVLAPGGWRRLLEAPPHDRYLTLRVAGAGPSVDDG